MDIKKKMELQANLSEDIFISYLLSEDEASITIGPFANSTGPVTFQLTLVEAEELGHNIIVFVNDAKKAKE